MPSRESSRPSTSAQRQRQRNRNGESSRKNQQRKRRSENRRSAAVSEEDREERREERERRAERRERRREERPVEYREERRGHSRGHSRGQSHGDRSSNTLSAGALAQLNQENARQKAKSERPKRVKREDYRAVDREPDRYERAERPRKHDRHDKKRRVVSGAVMEEGMARSGIRGGGWSEDSFDKEDFYQKSQPKKNKKKLCALMKSCHGI